MRPNRILTAVLAGASICVVSAGCSSDGGRWTSHSKNKGVLVTDQPLQDKMWYRDLDSSLTASVDKLKQLEGAKLEGHLKSAVQNLGASYSDAAKSLRDGYSFAYNSAVTDYSVSHGEQENQAIRESRERLAMRAGENKTRIDAIQQLADAFKKNPTDASFAALQQAVITLFRETNTAGLTKLDLNAMPGVQSSTSQTSGRDSVSQFAVGNNGPVQMVSQGDNSQVVNIIVVGAAEQLQKLGVDSKYISPAIIEKMIIVGKESRAEEGKPQPTVQWQLTEDGRGYIALPFAPDDSETRVTGNFDATPFLQRDRRARIELANVNPEDAKRFRVHVKSDVPFRGDGDRQVDDSINPGVGDEFLIEKKAGKDVGYYLAWRVDGMSRAEFLRRNPNAVIIIRLLD